MSYSPSVKSLHIDKDGLGGLPTGLRTVSNWIVQQVLTANSASSIAVPTGATKAILSCDQNFYANCNGTATIATVTDGTGSELNPVGYLFDVNNPVSTISVISAANGNVTAAFYKN